MLTSMSKWRKTSLLRLILFSCMTLGAIGQQASLPITDVGVLHNYIGQSLPEGVVQLSDNGDYELELTNNPGYGAVVRFGVNSSGKITVVNYLVTSSYRDVILGIHLALKQSVITDYGATPTPGDGYDGSTGISYTGDSYLITVYRLMPDSRYPGNLLTGTLIATW